MLLFYFEKKKYAKMFSAASTHAALKRHARQSLMKKIANPTLTCICSVLDCLKWEKFERSPNMYVMHTIRDDDSHAEQIHGMFHNNAVNIFIPPHYNFIIIFFYFFINFTVSMLRYYFFYFAPHTIITMRSVINFIAVL